MPPAGNAAAEALGVLLDLAGHALLNSRNWHALNERAVELLRVVAANKQLQQKEAAYRSLVYRLIRTLKARLGSRGHGQRGAGVKFCACWEGPGGEGKGEERFWG